MVMHWPSASVDSEPALLLVLRGCHVMKTDSTHIRGRFRRGSRRPRRPPSHPSRLDHPNPRLLLLHLILLLLFRRR